MGIKITNSEGIGQLRDTQFLAVITHKDCYKGYEEDWLLLHKCVYYIRKNVLSAQLLTDSEHILTLESLEPLPAVFQTVNHCRARTTQCWH